jgi:N-acetyl-anhydromuramyl-L-alanine amidase AmpD
MDSFTSGASREIKYNRIGGASGNTGSALFFCYTKYMLQKKTMVVSGIFLVFALMTGAFWWWQKNKGPVVYQNKEAFTKEVEEQVSTVEPTGETKPEQKEEALNSEAPEGKDVPEKITSPLTEESKEESKKEDGEMPKAFRIQNKLVSFGYESASGRKIDTIVLHSSHSVSGDPYDVDEVISLWQSYGVAPHYTILRDGSVYQLVADKNIAYHAGDSKMADGRSGVNKFSLGVEILNTKADEYTKAQYQATKNLIAYLKGKYGKMEVVGHNAIAPGRKTDPWNFDWNKL